MSMLALPRKNMKKFAVWCVISLLWAGQAQAQVDLRVTPESPVAFQSFSLHASGGGCDRFMDLDPSAREVAVQGGVIRVVVPYYYGNPCVLPLVPVTWTMPSVPPGNYRVELYGEYEYFDFPRTLVEAIDVVVQPGAAAPLPAVIPSTSWWALAALMMGIAWVTASRSRAWMG